MLNDFTEYISLPEEALVCIFSKENDATIVEQIA